MKEKNKIDYIALALILSFEEAKDFILQYDFFNQKKKVKRKLIKELSLKKGVYCDIILRRLKNVKYLMNINV